MSQQESQEEVRQTWIEVILLSIPRQPQSQCSLSDQLMALVPVANRLGLYDAADYIQKVQTPRK